MQILLLKRSKRKKMGGDISGGGGEMTSPLALTVEGRENERKE